MKKLLLLFFIFMQLQLMSQTTVNIGIISDTKPDNAMEFQFGKATENEIMLLLQHRHNVKFNTYYASLNQTDIAKSFADAYVENDIVIGLGTNTSNYAINLKDYPKPTIASIVLDAELQGLQKTKEGTSGIKNFTFMESSFDIARDLNLLYSIYPFDHLEVITEKGTVGETPFIKQLFAKYLQGKNVSVDHMFYPDNIGEHFTVMEGKKVAVYALPYLGKDQGRVKEIFQIINENKVPSAALFGEANIEAGALAGYKTEENFQKIPRRIALMTMKIVEGEAPADLSVEVQTFGENLIINMETARQIGIYPSFDIMGEATLINLDNIQTDNKLTLGLIGVILGLIVFKSSFGFMAFLGIISLAGIVINNAIVLLDRIKIEIDELGRSEYDGIVAAAQQRFRPILLTTFTTTLGLIPLYLGGGEMWEPMAISIMIGLLFATVITLLFVPVMYKVLFRVKREN